MQLQDFISSIEKEFEDVPQSSITGETEFRNLEGWSSMMALIIIAKIDSEFSVTMTAEEFARCKTINDLFEMVHAKAA
jgi:acyl carrier protein